MVGLFRLSIIIIILINIMVLGLSCQLDDGCILIALSRTHWNNLLQPLACSLFCMQFACDIYDTTAIPYVTFTYLSTAIHPAVMMHCNTTDVHWCRSERLQTTQTTPSSCIFNAFPLCVCVRAWVCELSRCSPYQNKIKWSYGCRPLVFMPAMPVPLNIHTMYICSTVAINITFIIQVHFLIGNQN